MTGYVSVGEGVPSHIQALAHLEVYRSKEQSQCVCSNASEKCSLRPVPTRNQHIAFTESSKLVLKSVL